MDEVFTITAGIDRVFGSLYSQELGNGYVSIHLFV
jgi:hypothetical protein